MDRREFIKFFTLAGAATVLPANLISANSTDEIFIPITESATEQFVHYIPHYKMPPNASEFLNNPEYAMESTKDGWYFRKKFNPSKITRPVYIDGIQLGEFRNLNYIGPWYSTDTFNPSHYNNSHKMPSGQERYLCNMAELTILSHRLNSIDNMGNKSDIDRNIHNGKKTIKIDVGNGNYVEIYGIIPHYIGSDNEYTLTIKDR